MKILVFLFLIVSSIFALETANNFTVTDLSGETHSLYDYLDEGKHVIFEFVSST